MGVAAMTAASKTRELQTVFTGYNHNLIIDESEFYDMKNMTGDFCPLLSPRKRRGKLRSLKNPQGLLAKEQLAWIDDNKLYYAGIEVAQLEALNCERQLISMGANIVIFPDKCIYNTSSAVSDESERFIYMENTFEAKNGELIKAEISLIDGNLVEADGRELTELPAEPQNGDYYLDTSEETAVLKVYSSATEEWSSVATTYVKISATGINNGFKLYDAVNISGFECEELNGSFPIWGIGEGFIVVTAIIDKVYELTASEENPFTVKREVPQMDYVVENMNRLWGCRWDNTVNTVYACTQGDATNWQQYLGTSQDSYYLNVGSDGKFTGAVVHGGNLLFFKENCIHKVYGSQPSNYQLTNITGRGILRESFKSACIVNETLYYLSKNGVCQYGGGVPSGIYSHFGGVRYKNAVGGRTGDKYYISMQDIKDKWHLFCFDESLQMWFKEDDLQVKFFAEDKCNLYYIDGDNNLCVMNADSYDGALPIEEYEKPFEWYAESGDIGIQNPDYKFYSKLQLRIGTETGTEIRVYIQYDGDGEWREIGLLDKKPKGIHLLNIPISTPKVDHFKLKIKGKGDAKIYAISRYYEKGSEVRGNGA